MKDLNLRRQSRGIYSPLPLAARATRQGCFTASEGYPIFTGGNNRELLLEAVARWALRLNALHLLGDLALNTGNGCDFL